MCCLLSVVSDWAGEILNLVNVAAQLYFMDKFLGHSLSSFGLDLLTVTDDDPYRRTDPLAVIFPKVTKCG